MEKNELEVLKEPVSRYTLTKSELNEYLDSLKDLLISNNNLIINANKEDIRHNKKQINVKDFLEIIEKYRKKECMKEESCFIKVIHI